MAENQPLDPVFLKFTPFEGVVPAGFRAEFTGALVSTSFKDSDRPNTMMPRSITTAYPTANEDYFEYVSVLKSINSARGSFVMAELGAGYGAWIVTAYKAIRQLKEKKDLSVFLVGVEADPAHFRMMHEHFRINGLDPRDHLLVQAAVTDHDGEVWFTTGSPREWWGQAVVNGPDYPGHQYPDQKNIAVKAVTLEFDSPPPGIGGSTRSGHPGRGVQGAFLRSGVDWGKGQAPSYRNPFPRNRGKSARIAPWSRVVCEADFPCGGTQETTYGRVDFTDGVQAWRNNRPL